LPDGTSGTNVLCQADKFRSLLAADVPESVAVEAVGMPHYGDYSLFEWAHNSVNVPARPSASLGLPSFMAASLGDSERLLGAGADQLALMLGDGGEDVDGELVSVRVVAGFELDAGLH